VIVAANLQKKQLTEKISLSRMENVQNIPTNKIYTIPNTELPCGNYDIAATFVTKLISIPFLVDCRKDKGCSKGF
jgi:hypothetical protein